MNGKAKGVSLFCLLHTNLSARPLKTIDRLFEAKEKESIDVTVYYNSKNMAHIHGQIESLKQIRNTLDAKEIDRFNSLRDFDLFLENYECEKASIRQRVEKELELDMFLLEGDIKHNYLLVEQTKSDSNEKFDAKISGILKKRNLYRNRKEDAFLLKQYRGFVFELLSARVKYLRLHQKWTLRKLINKMRRSIGKDRALLNSYRADRNNIIEERIRGKVEQLAATKEVVMSLQPIIAGAVGENLVVNEVKKLSNDYILINDFSLRFNPPIYNRKTNDRIFSIQIDHLLISRAGVFILETKNWSRKSVQSLDLRSPIEQVRRSGYALYVLLNGKKSDLNIRLGKHHWGSKSIPIRNVVVMINERPNEEFVHVKVKTLCELNGYIAYFNPIFSRSEVNEIAKGLIGCAKCSAI